MHVDSYSFGEMVVDGDRYENDLIIVEEEVLDGWWRDEGHRLKPQDLDAVVEADPKLLIVGTGNSGRMAVPEETREFLQDHGIEVRGFRTQEAVERFNEAEDAAGAFHLTC
ncbi:MAG: MTH938/NDUFAF3 family protein [Candidatus Nanohaloarchaea archaeon]|nr:MTH938/NDUFAF3 family protein [Candidatus Nanohaloarchaea archaeon]